MKNFYKLIVKIIFKIIYGKISVEKINTKNLKIYKVSKGKIKYKIFEIKNCRVFTTTIHDTAFLNNNRLVEKASFQIRNNISSNIKDNNVFINGTPRILKKLSGSLLCILTGGAGNDNYWHWMYDVLPRIALAEKYFDIKLINHFFVPNKAYKFQVETLNLLNINHKSISSKIHKHIYSDYVIATTHPWQHSNSAHKDISQVPKWISLWLRKRFLKFKSKKKFFSKIYIDRSDSKFYKNKQRIIINEAALREFLIKKKFKIVRLSDFSFKDQIAIFNSAKIIIGNHGAGFANLIFCKKNTKIVEFIDKNTAKTFKKTSKDLNLKYFSITGKRMNADKGNQNNNISISIKNLAKVIN